MNKIVYCYRRKQRKEEMTFNVDDILISFFFGFTVALMMFY